MGWSFSKGSLHTTTRVDFVSVAKCWRFEIDRYTCWVVKSEDTYRFPLSPFYSIETVLKTGVSLKKNVKQIRFLRWLRGGKHGPFLGFDPTLPGSRNRMGLGYGAPASLLVDESGLMSWFLSLFVYQEGTPLKSNIDIQNRHGWKEIQFPNHHFWYLYMLDFGGVYTYMMGTSGFSVWDAKAGPSVVR